LKSTVRCKRYFFHFAEHYQSNIICVKGDDKQVCCD